ncbi:MAG: gephyrin-like molybdotransferase Glp [Rhizobiaceae bacterium]
MATRSDLVPADQALEIILSGAFTAGEEDVPLNQAAGRVLARDLAALRTQPPFAASAMDGYAVVATDVATVPATLAIIGEAAAGHPFLGTLAPGQAVRIFTGAPVPHGADSIVIQENTMRDAGNVRVLVPSRSSQYVRPAGLDFATGDVLLHKGDVLDPQRLSLAAAMGHANLPVARRPLVGVMATGDELVNPGEQTDPGQIIASNTYGLAAIVENAGGLVHDCGIVADRKRDLVNAFEEAISAGCSLIVTTGGASVGDHDLIVPVALELGATIHFTRIAMRPGKPLIHATFQRHGQAVQLLGLAGNPVSSIVAAYRFVAPLVASMAARPAPEMAPVNAILGKPLPANDEREEYMRVTLEHGPQGTLVAHPFERQDSSMLANLARADALLIRPANAPAALPGEACKLLLLRR